jgi:hypothetical protein
MKKSCSLGEYVTGKDLDEPCGAVGAYAVYQQYSWDETQMKHRIDLKLTTGSI